MKIWAYGDSFVAGDQDIKGRVDAIPEYQDYNRYNVSFSSVLAKKLNCELTNRAVSGCSNFSQIDKLIEDSKHIESDDIVLFGITSFYRDRPKISVYFKDLIPKTQGPALGDRELLLNSDLAVIGSYDIFYTLSIIDSIEKIKNIKIIKFNAFHNFMDDCNIKHLMKFNNFISLHQPSNTLINLLDNTWGKIDGTNFVDHSKWSPPEKYRENFTRQSHPSIIGHKKIANWLYKVLKHDYNYSI